MGRFFRPVFLVFGVSLLLLTVLRALHPAQTQAKYVAIYGGVNWGECCWVYLLNERQARADRVRLASSLLSSGDNDLVSPSGKWKAAFVRLPHRSGIYLIPIKDNGEQVDESEMIFLSVSVIQPPVLYWSSQADRLFYFSPEQGLNLALFSITPDQENPRAERLTSYMFRYVYDLAELPLPQTHYTSYGLMLWSLNWLFLVGVWYYRRGK